MNKQRKNNWKELTLIIILTMIASFNFAQTEQDENYWPDSRIQKNGFFIEGYAGAQFSKAKRKEYDYNSFDYSKSNVVDVNDQASMVGMRMGNKFYMNSPSQKYSYGFQVTWLKLNVGIGDITAFSGSISALSPGFSSVYEINYMLGLEMNLDAGVAMSYYRSYKDNGAYHADATLGYVISPNVKLIIAGLAIGLDYSYKMRDWNEKSGLAHMVSLTLGRKF